MRRPFIPSSVPRRRLLLALLAAPFAGCASDRIGPDDPLVQRLRPVQYVLLGEVHDNAEQHRLHAALIGALLADQRRTCVVFEQMDRGRDEAIAAAPRDAESVATAGALDRSGWAWPMHRPVIDAALAAGATLRGGNLSRDDARAIVRATSASVPARATTLMNLAGWSTADESTMEREIDAGHCHALPERLWPAMALAERARDATLAETLLDAGRTFERVILIAGNGHVRRDLGVPRYLLGAGVSPKQLVAVGFLEANDADAPYDVVRVTRAAQRADPCVGFVKR